MKQEECLNTLMEKIKNNEDIRLDLKNGVILNLSYNDDEDIKAYMGYWEEENKFVGIWTKKTLIQILNKEIPDVELIL